MSSRLGLASLALGVILIGAAVVLPASADGPAPSAAPSVVAAFSTFSAGFAVWSLCGVLGLLVGVIASRRSSAPPLRDIPPWEPIVTPSRAVTAAPAADRFGIRFEPVEDSA